MFSTQIFCLKTGEEVLNPQSILTHAHTQTGYTLHTNTVNQHHVNLDESFFFLIYVSTLHLSDGLNRNSSAVQDVWPVGASMEITISCCWTLNVYHDTTCRREAALLWCFFRKAGRALCSYLYNKVLWRRIFINLLE